MKRKLFCLLLIFALILSACTFQENASSPDNTQQAQIIQSQNKPSEQRSIPAPVEEKYDPEDDYQKALRLIRKEDYKEARELLEELDGYKDSNRIISAIDAKPIADDAIVDIYLDHDTFNMSEALFGKGGAGLEITGEYSVIDYTFTEVWTIKSDSLMGMLGQIANTLGTETAVYDTDGLRKQAEKLYFQYFYPEGIIDITCATKRVDEVNDLTHVGTFGLEDIPAREGRSIADYDDVTEYATINGWLNTSLPDQNSKDYRDNEDGGISYSEGLRHEVPIDVVSEEGYFESEGTEYSFERQGDETFSAMYLFISNYSADYYNGGTLIEIENNLYECDTDRGVYLIGFYKTPERGIIMNYSIDGVPQADIPITEWSW